jgi:hypothetical protein
MLLIMSVALAAEIVVDAKVPVTLRVDGAVAAELRLPGSVRVEVPSGDHRVVLVAGTEEHTWAVTLVDGVPVHLMAGRGGVSMSLPDGREPPVAAGLSDVRFVVSGPVALMVFIDRQRLLVEPGPGRLVPVPVGQHEVSVRSADGAEVYARGVLRVDGGPGLMVQLAEGRLPETNGPGVSFVAGNR